ncbi:MAG: outer membrane lipoprotein chaperone LolA [Woeseiaceae bacterium]|nr:outer membrane lipoprotein chaperone LolA [Woeseiaceae bacterium]
MLRALFILAVTASCGFAAAADDNDRGRELVDIFVNDVETFAGRFEQTLIDPDGEVLESSTGVLSISRPGKFRWAYEAPYEQWLVADGLNIWSYDVDLAQVTVKPQAEALANTPALLLGGASNAMDEFEVVESDEEGGPTDELGLEWVRLQPVDADSGFAYVDLGFADDTLNRMVFLDNLQQTTIVYLTEVTVDEPVDAAEFRFEVPDDVDVVGTPAEASTP